MQRDNLDFKNMSVSKLFTKQLFPTLLGMVSSALFTVVDGIFVGRGIGSDAIAAVNIAAVSYTHLDVYKRQDRYLRFYVRCRIQYQSDYPVCIGTCDRYSGGRRHSRRRGGTVEVRCRV